MLLLMIVGNYKLRLRCALRLHKIRTKFYESCHAVKILNEETQKSQSVSTSLFRNEVRRQIQQLVMRVSDGSEYRAYSALRCDITSFGKEV
jgi:transposase-like protein